jgi:Ni,Fe-hydrogenase III large subunit/Ni,Fe-hydrogenase III component G
MAEYYSNNARPIDLSETIAKRWHLQLNVRLNGKLSQYYVECNRSHLLALCRWLFDEMEYDFASMVVEEAPEAWLLRYIFYSGSSGEQVHLCLRLNNLENTIPSISQIIHAADWHEREARDLFGLEFEGHPRLANFVLHEEWPDGVNPLRKDFDGVKPYTHRQGEPSWRPARVVQAPGVFMMPIGPVFSDAAESALFLLESVGEDVIRTTPRFFYKFRGVEKIAEGQSVDQALLLAERFSGTSAFGHSLAFCQAVETICQIYVPPRAKALRVIFAELERFRHHLAAIAGICNSTALAVATSQAGILEEEALRLCCTLTGHRYLFGLNIPGGVTLDLDKKQCDILGYTLQVLFRNLERLYNLLRYSSSFLDRLEEVGMVSKEFARSYGLVGPVARASGIAWDLRKALPYAAYAEVPFEVPGEEEGDGYARLRVLFREAEQSVKIIIGLIPSLPEGEVAASGLAINPGAALGWVEAPRGAAFHWVRIDEKGNVARYHLTTPSFINWHGFHLAVEAFAFQDFPIIMATFGLSNAECDR